MSGPPERPARSAVAASVGLAQILAWGSTYYLPAVLASPIATDTGWPMAWITGALSLALLIAGMVSPWVGRMIEAHGGRPVLAASAGLLAAGLAMIGLAPTLPCFVGGWAVLGLAMGAGLYDPAFATLGRLYGEQARAAITQVTLYAGFASTLCWPLSAFLAAHIGWRAACLTYAALALLVVLPLYRFGLPREAHRVPAPPRAASRAAGPRDRARRFAIVGFAAIMTLASVIATVVSVDLLALLQVRGLSLAQAVALGALIGPAQVGARLLEAVFGRRHHPVRILLISSIGVLAGLAMLGGDAAVIAVGLVLYGAGTGLRSIARGTVPLVLFGRDGYAGLMGRLARPALLAQAAAPALGAMLIDQAGARVTLGALCAAACVVVVLTLLLPVHPPV